MINLEVKWDALVNSGFLDVKGLKEVKRTHYQNSCGLAFSDTLIS
jgi:hypothetical protein